MNHTKLIFLLVFWTSIAIAHPAAARFNLYISAGDTGSRHSSYDSYYSSSCRCSRHRPHYTTNYIYYKPAFEYDDSSTSPTTVNLSTPPIVVRSSHPANYYDDDYSYEDYPTDTFDYTNDSPTPTAVHLSNRPRYPSSRSNPLYPHVRTVPVTLKPGDYTIYTPAGMRKH